MPDDAADHGSAVCRNIDRAFIGCPINGAAVLSHYAAEILRKISAFGNMISICLNMKGDAGNGIFNGACIHAGYTADIHLTDDGAAVDKIIIFLISSNLPCIAAGDAAYIVIPGDGGRFIVDQIGQSRIFSIFSDETAYVLAAGDFPVVAAVGDAAAVGAYQAAYIVTGVIGSRFPGYTGCIGNIFDILPCIRTDDTAYIITAADDAFVVSIADSAAVPAGNAAYVVRIPRTCALIDSGGNTEAVHIAQSTAIDTGDAAQRIIFATDCAVDCAVAAAVGNYGLLLIDACNAACIRRFLICDRIRCRSIGNGAEIVAGDAAGCVALCGDYVAEGRHIGNGALVDACHGACIVCAAEVAGVNTEIFHLTGSNYSTFFILNRTDGIKNAGIGLCRPV